MDRKAFALESCRSWNEQVSLHNIHGRDNSMRRVPFLLEVEQNMNMKKLISMGTIMGATVQWCFPCDELTWDRDDWGPSSMEFPKSGTPSICTQFFLVSDIETFGYSLTMMNHD